MTTKQEWRPNPGPQTDFLATSCYEALYGGAAGGGKSFALLMNVLRWVHLPDFRALILRRTYPDLEKALVGKSYQLYKSIFGNDADYNQNKHRWTFPSGAEVHFGALQQESDVYNYQGSEWQFLGFDELTHFTEAQYRYLLSRARSASGVPIRIRATTNPGGSGHEWVFKRWAPWLDPDCATHASPGEVLRYKNDDQGNAVYGVGRLSRTFIPARLEDNPHLAADGEYAEHLTALDAVTREQLRNGNWLIRPAKGLYFKRHWFDFLDAVPATVAARIRYWDRAASTDGDWSSGLRYSRLPSGIFCIEHVDRFRERPAGVEAHVLHNAEEDPRGTIVGIEEDPGQAGVADADNYKKLLAGFNVRCFKPTGDKITRAQPVSAQAEGRNGNKGNLVMVRGPWNEALLNELEAFPEGDYDDQVDSLSGAHNAISKVVTYKSFTGGKGTRL